jgi:hypothetical protein
MSCKLRIVESSRGNDRIKGEEEEVESKLVSHGSCDVGLLCWRQRRRAACCLDFVLGGEQWFACCGGETDRKCGGT